nr:helix-turn-helix domain-containing protein [Pandoraea iniqua]
MGPHAVVVYLVIKAHANFRTGFASPSIDLISTMSGVSRSQVIRALETLEREGYIERTLAGRSNKYVLREKVLIRDRSGQQSAIASWNYLPGSLHTTIDHVKTAMRSGDLASSPVVHIERLQVNVTQVQGPTLMLNLADIEGLPPGAKDALLSLYGKLTQ